MMFGRKKKREPRVRYAASKLSRIPGTKRSALARKREIRALRRGEPVI